MQLVSQLSEREKNIAWLSIVVLSIAIQISVLTAPLIAWMLIGLVGAFVLLNYPPYLWALAAVLLAVLSRILVATGFIPTIVNFLHFPFALGGAFLATVQKNSPADSATVRRLGFGVMGLLFISLASWVINGGDLLKPLLMWLVSCEPFLLIYTLLKDRSVTHVAHRLWLIGLIAVFAQVPFGLWQAARYGLGDPVAGTFVGTGGGAHIAGAVALTGALVLMAKYVFGPNRLSSFKYLIGFVILMIVPIIADAKAVFGIFLLGGLFLLFSSKDVRLWKFISIVPLSIALVYLTSQYYPPLAQIFQKDQQLSVVDRKFMALEVFKRHANDAPYVWFLGFGPGNTFSRVALLSSGGIARADSPVSWLRLSPGDITRETLNISFKATYGPAATSSAWQIWSSWIGVLGDLGLVGLCLYAWLWWLLWRQTRYAEGWSRHCARSLILTTVLLGMVYSWLEEPGFIFVAALFISLCLLEGKNLAHRHQSQLLPAARR